MPDRSESGLKFLPLLIGKCMFRRGRDAKTRPGSAGCWCQGYRKSGRVKGKCDDLMATVAEVVTVVDLMPSLGSLGSSMVMVNINSTLHTNTNINEKCIFKKGEWAGGRRDCSVARRTGCSSKESRFNSQCPLAAHNCLYLHFQSIDYPLLQWGRVCAIRPSIGMCFEVNGKGSCHITWPRPWNCRHNSAWLQAGLLFPLCSHCFPVWYLLARTGHCLAENSSH